MNKSWWNTEQYYGGVRLPPFLLNIRPITLRSPIKTWILGSLLFEPDRHWKTLLRPTRPRSSPRSRLGAGASLSAVMSTRMARWCCRCSASRRFTVRLSRWCRCRFIHADVADGGSAFTVPRPTNAAVHEGAPSGTGDGLSEVSIAPPSPWPGMPLRRHRRRPTGHNDM
jgi:hypothetical protein